MIKQITETSLTASRIFDLVNFLTENYADINEITEHLETNHMEIYTPVTIYKYLRTLRTAGIELIKKDNKFHIKKLPFNFKYTKEEIDGLVILENHLNSIPLEREKNIIKSLIENYLSTLNEELLEYFNLNTKENHYQYKITDEEQALINKCHQFIKDEQKIEISYTDKNNKTITVEANPLEIKYDNDEIYFVIFITKKGYLVNVKINSIINIKELPAKIKRTFIPTTTTFVLKGRLAKIYILKEGERSLGLDAQNNYVVINQKENNTDLIKRLLGYDTLCEIISPKEHRAEIIKELDEMLSYYED